MPKIDDIDNLGPMIYKLGLQPLKKKISDADKKEYKSVFTPDILDKILPTRTPTEDRATDSDEDLDVPEDMVDDSADSSETSLDNTQDDMPTDEAISDNALEDDDMGDDLNLDGLDDLVSDLGDDLNTLDDIENEPAVEELAEVDELAGNDDMDDMGDDLNLDDLDDLVSDLGDDLNTLDDIENEPADEDISDVDEPSDDDDGDLTDDMNTPDEIEDALDTEENLEPETDDMANLEDASDEDVPDLGGIDSLNDIIEEGESDATADQDEPIEATDGLNLDDIDDVIGDLGNLDSTDDNDVADLEEPLSDDLEDVSDDMAEGSLDPVVDEDDTDDLNIDDIMGDLEDDIATDDDDDVADPLEEDSSGDEAVAEDTVESLDDASDEIDSDIDDIGQDLDVEGLDDLAAELEDEVAEADNDAIDPLEEPDVEDDIAAEDTVEPLDDENSELDSGTGGLGDGLDIEDLDDLAAELEEEAAEADNDAIDPLEEPDVEDDITAEDTVEPLDDDNSELDSDMGDLGDGLDIEDLDDLAAELEDDIGSDDGDDLTDEPEVPTVDNASDDDELGDLDDLMSDIDHLEIQDTDDSVDDFDDLLDSASTSDEDGDAPNPPMDDLDDVIDDMAYKGDDSGDMDIPDLDLDDLGDSDESGENIDVSAFDADEVAGLDDEDDDDDLLDSLENGGSGAIGGSDGKYDSINEHLTEEDIEKILKGISFLPLNVQEHVVDAILNDKLDEEAMGLLITSLGEGRSKKEIGKILKDKIGIDVNSSGVYGDNRMGSIRSAVFGSYLPILIKTAAISLIILLVLVASYRFIYRPISANSFFKAGYEDLMASDYNSAERNFDRGDSLHPNQVKWYNKYANAYIERNAFTFAAEKIADALLIDEVKFETRMTEGAYFQQKAEFDMSPELYDEGEALYDLMLKFNYNKKQRLAIYDRKGLLQISRARLLGEKSYYANAYNTYKEMIHEYGDNVTARKRAMLIQIYTDNYDGVKNQAARIDFLQKDYFDDEVYPEYARYLLDKDEFHEARLLLEKILKKYPENILALVTLADYYGRITHYDTAEHILRAVLQLYDLEPHRSGREYVHNMLGQYYYIQGNYATALNEFEQAIAINSLYPDANYNLGNIYYYYESDYDKALNYYQVAYANMLDEYKPIPLSFNLGWIYYRGEEYDSAFEYFYDIYDTEQDNVVLNYALGNSLVNMSESTLAEGFYLDALSLLEKHRDSFGTMYMVRNKEFETLNYLASLYNNLGVVNVHRYVETEDFKYDRASFQNFVRASELFDQVRTARGDLIREANRTISLDNQSTGIATYNLLILQSGTPTYERVALDNYIPKDLYYIGQKPFERGH